MCFSRLKIVKKELRLANPHRVMMSLIAILLVASNLQESSMRSFRM